MPLPRSFALALALMTLAACPAAAQAHYHPGDDSQYVDDGSGYDDGSGTDDGSGYDDGSGTDDTGCDSEDVACLDDTSCDPGDDSCVSYDCDVTEDDSCDDSAPTDAVPSPAAPAQSATNPFVPIPAPTLPTLLHLHPSGKVWASPKLPRVVRKVVAAANRIAKKPYRYGGGHGTFFDTAYDCSGSVSYALHGGGLLNATLTSGMLEHWGRKGKGKWITVYANAGHTFMVVAGMRYDTGARPGSGTRWNPWQRPARGFVVRHPAGL
jgi:cell wall-associated NlpC family hydrolase